MAPYAVYACDEFKRFPHKLGYREFVNLESALTVYSKDIETMIVNLNIVKSVVINTMDYST